LKILNNRLYLEKSKYFLETYNHSLIERDILLSNKSSAILSNYTSELFYFVLFIANAFNSTSN